MKENKSGLNCGTSVFDFMVACGQTTHQKPVEAWEDTTFNLYMSLVKEEYKEALEAVEKRDIKNLTQEFVDLIVVTLGAAHSAGLPLQAMWDEVARANASKIDPETGKVRRREDGKILKPDNFVPADVDKVFETCYTGD